jgi:N-acylneuraminate cytidylyltransferase
MDGVLAFIPARSGSKRVPNKNIKLLGGIPLLAHSILTAKNTPSITRIIVSTDSPEYAEVAREYGAEALLRPIEISGDNNTICEAVVHLTENLDDLPEFIVQLQPATPIRDIGVVEDAIRTLQSRPDIDSLSSVDETPCNGWRCKTIEGGFLKDYKDEVYKIGNRNRQYVVKTYNQNGYVYVWRTSNIIKTKKIWGTKTLAYKTPVTVDIDTNEDFKYTEFKIMCKEKQAYYTVH